MRPTFVVFALASMACATPAASRAMVSPPVTSIAAPELRGSMAVTRVAGGEETNPMFFSRVGNEQLEEALRWSLEQSGFLSKAEKPAFALEATLVEYKEPAFGFTMTANTFIRYKITSTRDGAVVFDDIVTASYVATLGDAYYGPTRARIAAEGSVRENIAVFLKRLSALHPEGAK